MLRNNFIPPLLIALGILGAGISLSNAITSFRDFDRFVEVKGLDEEIVKSNQATWQINFSVSNNDLKQLYSNIASAQNTITNFWLQEGFQALEIQKQKITITDNDLYKQKDSNQPHYTANAGLTLSTSNVDLVSKASQKTGQLVESGLIINNDFTRYSYTDINSIKLNMLNKATENARAAAMTFAKNSHSQLGKIKKASQGQFTIEAADGSESYDVSMIMKKVRVVTSIQFFIK